MSDVFEDRRDLDAHRERLWALIEATPWLDWLLLTKRPQHINNMVPWGGDWPPNVWLGATVEDQQRAEERLPYLTTIPVVVRFISAEPLFGRLKLKPWIKELDWVIGGGESGPRARVPSPSHFLDLRDQCVAADVAFHFKQWGEWAPYDGQQGGGRIELAADGIAMKRVRKKEAGRVLDGATWDQWPVSRSTSYVIEAGA
jgi:protein gp37